LRFKNLTKEVRNDSTSTCEKWLAIVGIAGIAAGLITFYWPGITALVLITLIGAWILAHGILEIIGDKTAQ
jgi:uncharacterized membrane protein HdeD (DUF308 family)